MNNRSLENTILGYAAKFSDRYKVLLYALAIEGNHIQGAAKFPNLNRSHFMRDFCSCVARAVPRHVPEYPGGLLLGRRYSSEFMPGDEDIEDRFFYTVLQPVQDGLVTKISEYPGYNCFHDAVHGTRRKFTVVRWAEYNAKRRYDPNVLIKDFTDTVYLKYERLPGYEALSQKEYAKVMYEKLEQRRVEIVKQRLNKGLGFMGREKLMKVRPGSTPRSTKTSERYSHRPRVLSVCNRRRAECRAWYFDIFFRYKEASHRYRTGELDIEFPKGTYRPYYHPPPPT